MPVAQSEVHNYFTRNSSNPAPLFSRTQYLKNTLRHQLNATLISITAMLISITPAVIQYITIQSIVTFKYNVKNTLYKATQMNAKVLTAMYVNIELRFESFHLFSD